MIEGLQIASPRRMTLLRVRLILSLAVSMILSFRLWGAERYFPATPLIPLNGLPDWVNALTAILYMLMSYPLSLLARRAETQFKRVAS